MSIDLSTVLASVSAIAPLLLGIAAYTRRKSVEASQTLAATAQMIEYFDAANRGVVLVATYPAMPADQSAVGWLRSCGWTVVEYDMRQYVGLDLPTSERWRADLASADVVLLQGADAVVNTRLSADGSFREVLRPGAGVLLMVPSVEVRYPLHLWGALASGVTNPRTCEIAVRGMVAARRAMQRHQGTQRGGLGDAREALTGSR